MKVFTSAEPAVCTVRLRTPPGWPSKVCCVHRIHMSVYPASSEPKVTSYVILLPAALPKVMINVRTSVQTVMIGNSVEFECQAVGDPEPTVQWSKVGGSLPAHIMVKGGMLKIEQVTEADAGQYRCTATNDVGSVQSQVVLNVQCEYTREIKHHTHRNTHTYPLSVLPPSFKSFLFAQPFLKLLRCPRRRRWQLGRTQSFPAWLQDTLYLT